MTWECLCLETNCKASRWEPLALPIARGSDVYIACCRHDAVKHNFWCSLSLKGVTVESGLGSKIVTRSGIGRSKVIPVIKKSKNCLSALIVLVVHIRKR